MIIMQTCLKLGLTIFKSNSIIWQNLDNLASNLLKLAKKGISQAHDDPNNKVERLASFKKTQLQGTKLRVKNCIIFL